MTDIRLGAMELGGTKIRLAVGHGDGRILAETSFATGAPAAAFARARDFFGRQGVAAVGVAAFGPIRLARQAPDFGCIGATPKPGWSAWDIPAALAPLAVPIALDTDVNAAAIAEARHGAARGARVAVYLTVGTGIGGGITIAGEPVHGRLHPEVGHLPVTRAPGDDLVSVCPFHGDCAEGLASGPAIMARFGRSLDQLPAGDHGLALIADYLAQCCSSIILVASPDIIVIGGGVANTPGLHAAVAGAVAARQGHYLGQAAIAAIAPPGLGNASGLVGALILASAVQ